jgi:hypothetical protein
VSTTAEIPDGTKYFFGFKSGAVMMMMQFAVKLLRPLAGNCI